MTAGDYVSVRSARKWVEMGAGTDPIRVLHVDDDPTFLDVAATG